MYFLQSIKNWPAQFGRKVKSGRFIPEIDGLRFLAIVPVVIQHFSERLVKYQGVSGGKIGEVLGQGGMGVFLFFAISGFVLAKPFAEEAQPGGKRIALATYFKRRFIRIEPPFIIIMALCGLVLLAQGNPLDYVATRFLASITYTHTLIFGEHSVLNPVAWSLEVEIQFYLLAPFMARFLYQLPAKARRVLLIATLAVLMPCQSLLEGIHLWRYSLLGNLHYFLIGIVLLEFYLYGFKTMAKSFVWDLVGLVALGVMYRFSWQAGVFDFVTFAFATLALMIAAFKGILANRLVSGPWVMMIGGMCYSIYLIHLPLAEGMVRLLPFWGYEAGIAIILLVFLPIVLAVSVTYYRFVERPFMMARKLKEVLPVIGEAFKGFFQSFQGGKAKKVFGLFMTLGFATVCHGQTLDVTIEPFKLNVEQMVDSAVVNSPTVQAGEREVEYFGHKILSEKRRILNTVAIQSSYNYGNLGALTNSQTTLPSGDFALLSNTNTQSFYVGVGVKIPLDNLIDRKNKIQENEAFRDYKELLLDQVKENVRLKVMELHNDLVLAYRLVEINAESKESSLINQNMVELQFKKGEAGIDDFNRALESTAKARIMLEESKSSYRLAINQLEILCGGSLINFIQP